MELISLRGEESMAACGGNCLAAFGPNRIQAPPISWSQDGKSVVSSDCGMLGLGTARTVVLPYPLGCCLEDAVAQGLEL